MKIARGKKNEGTQAAVIMHRNIYIAPPLLDACLR
jgi:hypothetical protein